MKKLQRGFTLVELLVVIGILAILTAVVLVAVNPGRQLAQARNTQRQADINAILTAITAYMADPINNGQPPTDILADCGTGVGEPNAVADWNEIGTGGAANMVDLSDPVGGDLTPTYIADLPMDPSGGLPANTMYQVCSTGLAGSFRITVRAPNTEVPPAAAIFQVTR